MTTSFRALLNTAAQLLEVTAWLAVFGALKAVHQVDDWNNVVAETGHQRRAIAQIGRVAKPSETVSRIYLPIGLRH